MPSTPPTAPDPGADLLPANCGPSSQQLAQLDAAIAAAIPSFGSLAPNDSADIKGRQHHYLNLPGLIEAVRPALMAQQVIITSGIFLVPGGFVVATTLRHSGGGWRSSQFPILSLTSNSAIAAAATSGFRVNLQLLLGVCASEDATADGPAPPPQPWQQPAPAYGTPPAAAQDYAPPPQPWQQSAAAMATPSDPSSYV